MAMLEWMDLELLAFIERYAGQQAHWHVTAFFGSHPHRALSIAEVAQNTGVGETHAAASLGELVALGLLESNLMHGQTLYRLTVDPRLRSLAQRFARQSAVLLRLLDMPAMATGAAM